ncbi:hypothetical protein HDU92_005223 [Lobulomyces angularis]|nr:hypothetical protein HDU92_005223 [Lobulomyces angularis]
MKIINIKYARQLLIFFLFTILLLSLFIINSNLQKTSQTLNPLIKNKLEFTEINSNIPFNITDEELLLLSLDSDPKDFTLLGEHLRMYKKYYNGMKIPHKDPNSFKLISKVYSNLENKLFPWLKSSSYQTVFELENSIKDEQGIVMCVGDKYATMTFATIKIIREVFKSNLPFELFYFGESDLTIENRAKFSAMDGVVVKDLKSYINDDELQLSGRYDLKPFALLVSSFKHALLMDSDTVFLQPVENLFNSSSYTNEGAYFFHDRTWPEITLSRMMVKFLKTVLPENIPKLVSDLHLMQLTTFHEMESGVVLMDKSRHLIGLLAACSLISKKERKPFNYDHYGDKELFWIGLAVVRENFTFSKYESTGVLGVSTYHRGLYTMCNLQILHLDEEDNPLWFNGGLFENKKVEQKFGLNNRLAELTEYLVEPGYWEKEGFCLVKEEEPIKFNDQVQNIIKENGRIQLIYSTLKD